MIYSKDIEKLHKNLSPISYLTLKIPITQFCAIYGKKNIKYVKYFYNIYDFQFLR